ncbi:MAG TPA: DotU family type IV/VI secretion system protein [Myxococcota bacterium]|nr:DotU family type IV/VI secretion system protein [Myxococcota bacterium]
MGQGRLTRLAGAYVAHVQSLRAGDGRAFPDAPALRAQLLALLAPFHAAATAQGIPGEEVEEARFALVAWTDEVLSKASWAGRDEWLREPLQTQLYRTNRAGNEFYAHLAKLRPDQAAAREVYFLALALGFEGQYQGQEAERRALIAREYEALRAAGRLAETSRESQLSPGAYALDIELPRRASSGLLLGLGALALGMAAVYGLLWVVLHATSGNVPVPRLG